MKKNNISKEDLRIAIVEFAKQFVGIPYKYGATLKDAPNAFDCSGFTQYIYSQFDCKIPRSTILQAEFAGKKIESTKKILPGDLVFLHSTSGHYNKKFPQGIGHVVMYLGNNKAIHATSKRYQTYPNIIEKGSIKIESFSKIIQKGKPLVIIKRIV